MKKRLVILLCAVLMLMQCAATALAQEAMTVVATTYPLYDMARTIGAQDVHAVYAPEGAQEAAADAAIVLCVGSDEDAWTESMNDKTVLRVRDVLALEEGAENALTIPINAVLMAYALSDALASMEEAGAAAFTERVTAYTDTMLAMDADFREAIPDGLAIACPDGSMSYFAQEYGAVCAEDAAVALYTYNKPASQDDLAVPYSELMARNLETIRQAAK